MRDIRGIVGTVLFIVALATFIVQYRQNQPELLSNEILSGLSAAVLFLSLLSMGYNSRALPTILMVVGLVLLAASLLT